MKKLLLGALVAITMFASVPTAFAELNDIRIAQSDAEDGLSSVITFVPYPLNNGVGLMAYDGSVLKPKITLFGTGIVWTPTSATSGVLGVADLPIASVTDLQTALDGKADLSHTHVMTDITGLTAALSGKASSTHSHVISDVTGLQTALDAKAALSSLATVATSGAYTDLTGKPSLATVATSGSYNDLTNKPTLPLAMSFATATHSLVTSTGASGFQISSTRNTMVTYAVNIATVASLGAPSAGYIALEIAPTNSATATDWYEVGARCRVDNTVGLLAVQSSQGGGCSFSTIVPAGYYAKLRTVTVSGSPTFTYISGSENQM